MLKYLFVANVRSVIVRSQVFLLQLAQANVDFVCKLAVRGEVAAGEEPASNLVPLIHWVEFVLVWQALIFR